MLQVRYLILSVLFVFLLMGTSPVFGAVIEGPDLIYSERNNGDFGLLIRAEADVNLISVRFPNQGQADMIKLRRLSDSALLASFPVAAGNTNAIVNINYPLAAGEVYSLVASTWSNKYYGSVGTGFPVGNAEITILSSYRTSPYYSYWLSFNDITTDPAVIVSSILEAAIDIKPGTDVNSINLKSKGVVPVAVLTTEDFDTVGIDSQTVLFAGAPPVRWQIEDINGDGHNDILFHFKTQDMTDLSTGSTEAALTGTTFDGIPFSGMDAVNIIPGK
jgi:hypothetical protein